jgi:hypothetical protein
MISLLVVATLLSALAIAREPVRPTMDNGVRRMDVTLHGRISCVLVDNKIFCARATTHAPIKLAHTISE